MPSRRQDVMLGVTEGHLQRRERFTTLCGRPSARMKVTTISALAWSGAWAKLVGPDAPPSEDFVMEFVTCDDCRAVVACALRSEEEPGSAKT